MPQAGERRPVEAKRPSKKAWPSENFAPELDKLIKKVNLRNAVGDAMAQERRPLEYSSFLQRIERTSFEEDKLLKDVPARFRDAAKQLIDVHNEVIGRGELDPNALDFCDALPEIAKSNLLMLCTDTWGQESLPAQKKRSGLRMALNPARGWRPQGEKLDSGFTPQLWLNAQLVTRLGKMFEQEGRKNLTKLKSELNKLAHDAELEGRTLIEMTSAAKEGANLRSSWARKFPFVETCDVEYAVTVDQINAIAAEIPPEREGYPRMTTHVEMLEKFIAAKPLPNIDGEVIRKVAGSWMRELEIAQRQLSLHGNPADEAISRHAPDVAVEGRYRDVETFLDSIRPGGGFAPPAEAIFSALYAHSDHARQFLFRRKADNSLGTFTVPVVQSLPAHVNAAQRKLLARVLPALHQGRTVQISEEGDDKVVFRTSSAAYVKPSPDDAEFEVAYEFNKKGGFVGVEITSASESVYVPAPIEPLLSATEDVAAALPTAQVFDVDPYAGFDAWWESMLPDELGNDFREWI